MKHSLVLDDVIDALYSTIEKEFKELKVYPDRGSMDCFQTTGIPLSGSELIEEDVERKQRLCLSVWNNDEIDPEQTYNEYECRFTGTGQYENVEDLAAWLNSDYYNGTLAAGELNYCEPGVSAYVFNDDDEDTEVITVCMYFLAIAE